MSCENNKKINVVEISGDIFPDKGKTENITENEFLEKFILFVESNGWLFAGSTKTREDTL